MARARPRITLAEKTRTRPDQREVHVKKDRLRVCHRTDYRIRVYTFCDARLERHPEPAPHRLSDEGEPAGVRAGHAGAMGEDESVRGDSRAAAGRAQIRAA